MSNLHEECGVFGIYNNDDHDVVNATFYGLYALQHRGQESCGMAVNTDGVITGYKDVGLVGEVFTKNILESMARGNMAIGHCRYSTTGTPTRFNAQPLVIDHIKGSMALAHNGNLTNAGELRSELELSGAIFHTTSDSEVIAYTITKERIKSASIEEAVIAAVGKIKGAFSIVMMSPQKMIAIRDPLGFRPLCLGMLDNSYVIASETCALDCMGAHYVRDVEPGEIIMIDKDGLHSYTEHCNQAKSALCVFELIYFARPDSIIDGCNVHIARQRAGAYLALEHPIQADVVIGVPDSGLDAALGYAKQSGIPYGVGLIKNKYIARTFIQPTQKQRENSVRIKLNPVPATVKGKRVIMVDDSIVRGTTSARIVKLLRDAGATEVHMLISSPPFKHPCYFGTDIDSREHLIACKYDVEGTAKFIGVDSLGYLSCRDVVRIADQCSRDFCDGCFTGNYPIDVPDDEDKSKFENSSSAKRK